MSFWCLQFFKNKQKKKEFHKTFFITFKRFIPKQSFSLKIYFSESTHGLRTASKNRSKTYAAPCRYKPKSEKHLLFPGLSCPQKLNHSPQGDTVRFQVYPETLRRFRMNPSFSNGPLFLGKVSSLTLNNSHYVVSDLCFKLHNW